MASCPYCHVLLPWPTQQQYQQHYQQSDQVGTSNIASYDLRSTIPDDIANRLMADEQVLYYASGGGCLSGGRTYFLLTDSRAMLTGIQKNGCLGIGGSAQALDIPLEHITSTGTEKSGCIFPQGIVTVSSGTATERVLLANQKAAEEASMTLQQLLRERRKNKYQ